MGLRFTFRVHYFQMVGQESVVGLRFNISFKKVNDLPLNAPIDATDDTAFLTNERVREV